MNSEAVSDWLRVRRELLEVENAFTSLAIRAIDGEVSEEQLQRERLVVEDLRALCSAAYQRAFPTTSQSTDIS